MEGRKKDEGAAPWTHLQLGFRPEQRRVRQVLVVKWEGPPQSKLGGLGAAPRPLVPT